MPPPPCRRSAGARMSACASGIPLELLFVHLLERLLEAAVVLLEDGVLGRQVKRVVAAQRVVEGRAREVADRVVEIVHGERHAAAWKIEHLLLDLAAVRTLEGNGERSLARDLEIGR